MDDRIETGQMFRGDVADVHPIFGDYRNTAARRVSAALIQVGVAAGDLMPRLLQHGHHDSANVAQMPRNKNLHRAQLLRLSSRKGYTMPACSEGECINKVTRARGVTMTTTFD